MAIVRLEGLGQLKKNPHQKRAKVNVNLSLYLIKHHVIKTYGGVEV
jgi:hypothetical protein